MDQMYNSLKRKSLVYLLKSPRLRHLAAYGQIIDVLFGNNKFPLSVDPTVLPDGVSESVHINIDPAAEAGFGAIQDAFTDAAPKPYLIGPDTELEPGETIADLQKRLGGCLKS